MVSLALVSTQLVVKRIEIKMTQMNLGLSETNENDIYLDTVKLNSTCVLKL